MLQGVLNVLKSDRPKFVVVKRRNDLMWRVLCEGQTVAATPYRETAKAMVRDLNGVVEVLNLSDDDISKLYGAQRDGKRRSDQGNVS